MLYHIDNYKSTLKKSDKTLETTNSLLSVYIYRAVHNELKFEVTWLRPAEKSKSHDEYSSRKWHN